MEVKFKKFKGTGRDERMKHNLLQLVRKIRTHPNLETAQYYDWIMNQPDNPWPKLEKKNFRNL